MRYEWRTTKHGPQIWDLEKGCWALWYGIGAIGVSEELKRDIETLQSQRDEARYNARILAHAYEHDSRPPERIVRNALSYPVKP